MGSISREDMDAIEAEVCRYDLAPLGSVKVLRLQAALQVDVRTRNVYGGGPLHLAQVVRLGWEHLPSRSPDSWRVAIRQAISMAWHHLWAHEFEEVFTYGGTRVYQPHAIASMVPDQRLEELLKVEQAAARPIWAQAWGWMKHKVGRRAS